MEITGLCTSCGKPGKIHTCSICEDNSALTASISREGSVSLVDPDSI